MPAPTDTFVQNLFQTFGAPPLTLVILALAIIVLVCLLVVFYSIWKEIHSFEAETRRRKDWDQQLHDNQRNERRPAHWGFYK